MTEKILKEKLNEIRKELIKINSQIAVGTIPEKPGRIREMKRTVAKIHTQLSIRKKTGGKQKLWMTYAQNVG
mgnify:CR=1 FL=1